MLGDCDQVELELGEPSRTFLNREIPQNNFDLLPISLDHATSVEDLEPHHKDPFDRLIIAQAMVEDIPIVGSDPTFDAYPIKRMW